VGFRLRGGASLPSGRVGRIGVTWPMAVLSADDNGIEVAVHPGWIRGPWRVSWGDLELLLIGPRSVVLRPVDGRSCRFVALRRRDLQPLLGDFDKRGIPARRVKTTMHEAFKIV
jgi:hypothetical protein